jgi:hypothetical protein
MSLSVSINNKSDIEGFLDEHIYDRNFWLGSSGDHFKSSVEEELSKIGKTLKDFLEYEDVVVAFDDLDEESETLRALSVDKLKEELKKEEENADELKEENADGGEYTRKNIICAYIGIKMAIETLVSKLFSDDGEEFTIEKHESKWTAVLTSHKGDVIISEYDGD